MIGVVVVELRRPGGRLWVYFHVGCSAFDGSGVICPPPSSQMQELLGFCERQPLPWRVQHCFSVCPHSFVCSLAIEMCGLHGKAAKLVSQVSHQLLVKA